MFHILHPFDEIQCYNPIYSNVTVTPFCDTLTINLPLCYRSQWVSIIPIVVVLNFPKCSSPWAHAAHPAWLYMYTCIHVTGVCHCAAIFSWPHKGQVHFSPMRYITIHRAWRLNGFSSHRADFNWFLPFACISSVCLLKRQRPQKPTVVYNIHVFMFQL